MGIWLWFWIHGRASKALLARVWCQRLRIQMKALCCERRSVLVNSEATLTVTEWNDKVNECNWSVLQFIKNESSSSINNNLSNLYQLNLSPKMLVLTQDSFLFYMIFFSCFSVWTDKNKSPNCSTIVQIIKKQKNIRPKP